MRGLELDVHACALVVSCIPCVRPACAPQLRREQETRTRQRSMEAARKHRERVEHGTHARQSPKKGMLESTAHPERPNPGLWGQGGLVGAVLSAAGGAWAGMAAPSGWNAPPPSEDASIGYSATSSIAVKRSGEV